MIKEKHLWTVFLPAILLAGLVFTIRLIQYEPLYEEQPERVLSTDKEIVIPIFPEDPLLGSRRAPKTIVLFEDFGCPACAEQMRLLDALITKYPEKIRIIWKGLSVTRVPYSSETAHIYGFCAHEQKKFAAYAQNLFTAGDTLSSEAISTAVESAGLDTDLLSECVNSPRPTTYLANTRIIAEALGIQSVPAIFIDNTQVTPPQFIEGWETLLGL